MAAALIVALAGLFLFFAAGDTPIPVRAAKVERVSLVSDLTTNGKVEPLEPFELRASMPGMVRSVLVKEGDHVKKGQRLLELDRGEAAAEAARAEAELRTAQADLESVERGGTAGEIHELESQLKKARAERDEAARLLAADERLLKQSAIARIEVDQARERLRKAGQDLAYLEQRRQRRFDSLDREKAQARVNEARAALALARSRLASTGVTSPVEGTLYSLPVREGNYVNRGDLLARVGDLQRLRVRVFVDEPELGRLAANQEVLVTWDAYPGVTWKGKVERLPAEVTVLGTRSVGQVDCAIENADGRLLPQVNVNVEIVTRRSPSALTVPKEAVVHENPQPGRQPERHSVFAIVDGRLQRREVTVGISNATRVEIRKGMEEGQLVALPMERKLEAGMRVKPVEGAQP